MTPAKQLSLALMGGAGALYGALIADKSAPLYIACMNVYDMQSDKTMSLRAFMIRLLREGLAAKDNHITIGNNVYIVNPWISSDTPNVVIPAEVISKFASVLGDNILSPYSADATQALKSAFPPQWITIRDYGFAHPDLVPFINEDPMLVMSLIDGLGTRWLVTADGGAYVNTNIKPKAGMHIKAVFANTTTTTNWACFGSRVSGNTKCLMVQLLTQPSDKRVFYGFGSTTGSIFNKYSAGDIVEAEIIDSRHEMILNGTSYNIASIVDSDLEMTINRVNTSGTHANGAPSKWQYLEIEGVAKFVPFVSATRNGMLDIVSATFHQNLGTSDFTISEQPANS